MEKENAIWEWIKNFEKTYTEDKINEQVIQKLAQVVAQENDIYLIRKKYKKILDKTRKYDPNYYAHICIVLNVIESKKDRLENTLIGFEEIKYIRQRIAGQIITRISNNESTVRYITKEVEYDYIHYPEGIGTAKTNEMLKEILIEARVLLNQERLDLEKAKKWVKKYRKYIIMTYGRWSKEYEKYMNTAFEIPVFGTAPNILLLAMRETMRKGIENSIINNRKRSNKNGRRI